jgi:hypothetical protein
MRRLLTKLMHKAALIEIAAYRTRIGAQFTTFPHDRIERILPTSGHDHVGAFARQCNGRRPPDARAAAGHQCGTPCQPPCH